MYAAAREVRAVLDRARGAVAQCLGARPAEVVFTAGGTEANNLAIHGVMQQYPAGRLLVSAIEHDSVLAAAEPYVHDLIPVTADGFVDPEELGKQVTDDTVLISVMYVNNEIGTIQPIREISRLITGIRRERRERGVVLPLYFHTDAAQAANYLDLQVARLGVDMLTLNGGKIYGPKQSGILYVRGGLKLEPLVRGGGQERGLRSGTENVPSIIGFAAGLTQAQDMRHDESKRLADLQRDFFASLPSVLPTAVVNGSTRRRLPNNIHVTLPGSDNERLLFGLDAAGIMAAAGSACSASSEESSHVLRAIGLDDGSARASLRLTMGRGTSKADLDRTAEVLRGLLAT